uniref:Pentatricopeptide repeat-containing protein At5g39980, chloroplastic n=1 Tax=Elaeis guineensis var. tenera TaxID=51953 RepID=A0A6I9SER8_ELAGV|nr:pentatricopeptide repeat-containing protein At5g39980, chloroplastic [Elaeis guineensis]
MLLCRRLRRLRPIFPSQSTPLPIFYSDSSPSQNTPATATSPPRKGQQAVRRLLKLLSPSSQNAHDPNLSHALDALRTSPTTISASAAATLVSAAADPLLAFDFYRFLRSLRPHFHPDSSLLSALLRTQLRSRSPHPFRIRFYLGEMRKHCVALSPADFRSLFTGLFPERCDLARSLLDQLIEVLGPSSEIYSIAIAILTENGLIDEAIKVSERAKTEIDSPALGFYSSLMNLYMVTGDGKVAMEAFLEMGERGILADEEIYRNLLGILCQVGWMKLSWVVLEEMMKNATFRHDEALSLDLMKGFLKQGMVSEAGFLLREGMIKKKESFFIFAEAMVKKKMVMEAFDLLRTVCEPEFYAASLIHGCGKLGLIEEAEKIFREIKSLEGNKMLDSMYASMIYVYSKAGLRRLAEVAWEEMEVAGALSGEACLYMMSMYGELGLFEKVAKMFDRWLESGVCVNVEGYGVLINALVKAGKLKEARSHLSDMRSHGIQLTSSIYSLLMEGYLKAGLLNHALAMLEEYKISGLRIEDGVLASNIAHILIKAGRYHELDHYLDIFGRSAVKFSGENGASLIECCTDELCLRKITSLIECSD